LAVFEYKALNTRGKKINGVVEADSLYSAQKRLRSQRLYPVSLTQIRSEIAGTAGDNLSWFRIIRSSLFLRIRSSEIVMVTRLMATLLSAGFPLVKTVATVAGHTRSRTFQNVLTRVKDAVEAGSSFADALRMFPRVFSGVFVNMIAAGESSGTLEVVLERLADFAEKKEETWKKILAAIAYPIMMSVIGFLVLVILLTYIVPGIVQIFVDMNQTLPLPTQILVYVSDFFTRFWWAILLAPLVAYLALSLIRKTDRGLFLTDLMLLRMPVAGGLITKLITARFTRTLGSLLENGVPLLTSLSIAGKIAGNRVISDLISTAADQVEQGGTLGGTLSSNSSFPSLAVRMIQVGETSGELEKMLIKTADLYDRDVQTALAAATAMLEPVIILVLGLVVGLIILAVCLPIVEINQLVM
jgi:general secretion pathway protein F